MIVISYINSIEFPTFQRFDIITEIKLEFKQYQKPPPSHDSTHYHLQTVNHTITYVFLRFLYCFWKIFSLYFNWYFLSWRFVCLFVNSHCLAIVLNTILCHIFTKAMMCIWWSLFFSHQNTLKCVYFAEKFNIKYLQFWCQIFIAMSILDWI